MKVYRKLEISCAHHLNLPYESKCLQNHGHTFYVEIWIEGPVNPQGMVIDFSKIKEVVKVLDHKNLNDFLPQPTCENVVKFYLKKLSELVKGKIKVRVWETSNSYAEKEVESL